MKECRILLRKYLAEYTATVRGARSLTQEEMAERLRITTRAYGDLERGKYCFSASTLLFLLLMLTEDEREAFLSGFHHRACALEQEGAA